MNDLELEQPQYNAKWDLVQFFFLATYTVGFYGTTSLPYFIQKYTGKLIVSHWLIEYWSKKLYYQLSERDYSSSPNLQIVYVESED